MPSTLIDRVRSFLERVPKEAAVDTPTPTTVTAPRTEPDKLLRMADCHPDRLHRAHGLCSPCYGAKYRAGTVLPGKSQTEWPGLLDEVLGKVKSLKRVPHAARIPFVKVILRNHATEVITVDQFLKEMPKILLPSNNHEQNRSNLLRTLKRMKIADIYRNGGKTYVRTKKSFTDINEKRLAKHVVEPSERLIKALDMEQQEHADAPAAIPHVVHVGLPKHIRDQMAIVQEADHASKMALETGRLLQMLTEWDIKLERH